MDKCKACAQPVQPEPIPGDGTRRACYLQESSFPFCPTCYSDLASESPIDRFEILTYLEG